MPEMKKTHEYSKFLTFWDKGYGWEFEALIYDSTVSRDGDWPIASLLSDHG